MFASIHINPQDGAPPLSNLEYLTEAEMAAEISNYEKGSVAYLGRSMTLKFTIKILSDYFEDLNIFIISFSHKNFTM